MVISRWWPVLAPAAMLALAPAPGGATAQDGGALASSLTSNVARIEAGDRTGFGFVVGLHGRDLVLATARHTLDGPGGDAPRVCFALRSESCVRGAIFHIADAIGTLPALDLAFLTVPYPEGLAWQPDADGGEARKGEAVWSIGRANEWYIPERGGRVTGIDPSTRLVSYAGLEVAEGVSGAPIVTGRGIVALHVESTGDESRGISLAAVRERLEAQARVPWLLVPRADCTSLAVHRTTLADRPVALHFDPAAPAAALQAAARLSCLGADVRLVPVWQAARWEGNGITYRTNDVRLMRTVQVVLAPLGRLDATLGQPVGGIDLWIR